MNAIEAKKINVLLVEDSASDVFLIREAFKEVEFAADLHNVSDGVEALRYLYKEGIYQQVSVPDLIILDLNLPRKNGKEVLQEIKHHPILRRIPVIVLTTSNAEEDVNSSYDLHANCYICKPILLDKFFYVILKIKEFWQTTVLLPSYSS